MNIKAIAFDAYGTLFNVHSVVEKCEEIYPGYGTKISDLWRAKQLEYTWLRSLMGRYRDFWGITEDALVYTLKNFHLDYDEHTISTILERYLYLQPYDEIPDALDRLKEKFKLAILSNGSPNMLHDMVENANLEHSFEQIISVDELQIFKPFSGVYQLGPAKLNMTKDEILFVSSNPFDIAGAKVFGYRVCWINRLNLQREEFNDIDAKPDIIIKSLSELENFVKQC